MPRRTARLFPVGLYATLLVAFCALVAPAIPRRLEARARDVISLPLRGMAFLQDAPPAVPSVQWPEVATLRRLGARHALGSIRIPDREPVFATVVQRLGRHGRRTTQLTLDVAAESVAVGDPVTAGDVLIGRIGDGARPGTVLEVPGRAVVDLLNYRPDEGVPWRVPAEVAMPTGDPVRFLLEPANDIDREPLRCRLLEDPYRIAGLRRSGQPIRTAHRHRGPPGAQPLPSGLGIGTLRVWGYAQGGAPIELLVRPTRSARALATVVVWRRANDLAVDRLARPSVLPVSRLRLPAPLPVGERWLLAGASVGRARLGAAVVATDSDGSSGLAGVVRVVGGGYAMATPIGRFASPMAWILVPRGGERSPTASAAPIEFAARIVRIDGRHCRVLVDGSHAGGSIAGSWSGRLFTGPNGADCPAWIPVGDVESIVAGSSDESPADGETFLRLTLPPEDPEATVVGLVLQPSASGEEGGR